MPAEINWKFILNTIKSEKCVLLLGPELFTHNNKTLNELLTDFLDIKNNQNIHSYYEADELFLFADGMSKTMTYYEVKDFYNHNLSDELYSTIAQLPFHLIISITPELKLHQTFTKLNIEHNFSFYNKSQNPKDVETPSKDIPLVYNLFGSIEQEESLILTHDDLFDFMFASMGNQGLPKELRNALNQADNFIFLGFQFKKWYLQVLLRLLNPKKEKYKFALNKEHQVETNSFYVEQFKVNFAEIEPQTFINELYVKCAEQNMLRTVNQTQTSVSATIKNLIEKDEIEKALHKLKSYFEDQAPDLLDDISLLTSRYNRLRRKMNSGVVETKEAELEMNKIKEAILSLNQEIKE